MPPILGSKSGLPTRGASTYEACSAFTRVVACVVADPPERSTGWANYFTLGQVSPAYEAIDRHATRRLRQWLCRKHKVRTGKDVRFPVERLWSDYGLTHLAPRTARFPWAKA